MLARGGGRSSAMMRLLGTLSTAPREDLRTESRRLMRLPLLLRDTADARASSLKGFALRGEVISSLVVVVVDRSNSSSSRPTRSRRTSSAFNNLRRESFFRYASVPRGITFPSSQGSMCQEGSSQSFSISSSLLLQLVSVMSCNSKLRVLWCETTPLVRREGCSPISMVNFFSRVNLVERAWAKDGRLLSRLPSLGVAGRTPPSFFLVGVVFISTAGGVRAQAQRLQNHDQKTSRAREDRRTHGEREPE